MRAPPTTPAAHPARTRTRTAVSARAFSLLEVTVASALFAIAITGILSGLSTATDQYAHQRLLTQALSAGEFALEELLLRYSSDPDLEVNAVADSSGNITSIITPKQKYLLDDLSPAASAATARYEVSWTVTRCVAVSSLKHVRVTVSWKEGVTNFGDSGGTLRRIELQTYRP